MSKLVDAKGNAMLSLEEQRTGVPDWVREPIESWPIEFRDAWGQEPPKFILGRAPIRAVVLMDRDFRAAITIADMVALAAGAYEAVAKCACKREQAEMVARAWLKLLADADREGPPDNRIDLTSKLTLH